MVVASGESSKPTTATSPGIVRPAARRAATAPTAMRSDATNTASRLGRAREQPLHRRAAALEREVGDLDDAVVRPDAGRREPLVIAGQPIGARGHVLRPGDRRDPAPPAVEQMLDRAAGAAAVVDVDVVTPRPGRPAADDERDAVPAERGGQRIGAVQRDQQDAVDVAGRRGIARRAPRRSSLGHEQDELHRLVGRARR